MIYSDNELSLKSFQSLKIDVPKLGKFRNLKPPPLPHSPVPFPINPYSPVSYTYSSTPILTFPLHFSNLFPHSSISSITQSSFFHPVHSLTLFLRFLSLLHFSVIILPTPLFLIPLCFSWTLCFPLIPGFLESLVPYKFPYVLIVPWVPPGFLSYTGIL